MKVFKCNHCSRIHLEIGNTQIHFNLLLDLKKYLTNLDSIDATYYAAVNRKKGLSKVIILPLDHSGNIHLGLTELEFDELKTVIRNYLCSDKKDNMATCKIELNSLNWN